MENTFVWKVVYSWKTLFFKKHQFLHELVRSTNVNKVDVVTNFKFKIYLFSFTLNFQLGESLNQPKFSELCTTDESTEFEAQKRFYENYHTDHQMVESVLDTLISYFSLGMIPWFAWQRDDMEINGYTNIQCYLQLCVQAGLGWD